MNIGTIYDKKKKYIYFFWKFYYDDTKGSESHALHACMKEHDFGTRKT